MGTYDEQTEVVGRLVGGIVEGTVQPTDFVPLDPTMIADGWRRGVHLITNHKVDERVILALNILRVADPQFPSGDFVLGLAYEEVGDHENAKKHFQAQLDGPFDRHDRECQILLEEIDGKAH